MTIAPTNTDLISNNLRLNLKQWWVEINTAVPHCTYYFGPFNSLDEAVKSQEGYIKDLIEEGATGIKIDIKKQFQPHLLTVEAL